MNDQNDPQNQPTTEAPSVQSQPAAEGAPNPWPQPEAPQATVLPVTQPQKHSKKSRTIMGAVIALLLVLLGVGAFTGYTYLNNKPEKVLADAFTNTVSDLVEKKPASTLGTVAFEAKGDNPLKLSVAFDSKSSGENSQGSAEVTVDFSDKTYKIKTSAVVFGEEEFYFKVENLKATITTLVGNQPEFSAYSDLLDPIVSKIDNQWIKITKDDLKELGMPDEQTVDKCSTALQNIKLSADDKKQLKKLFKENQFIVANETLKNELVASENSFHYKLDFNNQAAENFAQQILKMESFKAVKEGCDIDEKTIEDGFKESGSASDNKDTPKPVVELWVGKKSRRPTKFRVSANNKDLTLNFNTQVKLGDRSVTVEKPSSSISIQELKAEFEKLIPTGVSNP